MARLYRYISISQGFKLGSLKQTKFSSLLSFILSSGESNPTDPTGDAFLSVFIKAPICKNLGTSLNNKYDLQGDKKYFWWAKPKVKKKYFHTLCNTCLI